MRMIVKTLQLIFQNAAGTRTTITVPDPTDTLTEADVQGVMDLILTKNVFSVNGGDLVAKVAARVTTRETVDLQIV